MDDLLRGERVIYLYFYLGFEFWVSSFGFWALGFDCCCEGVSGG